jgi:hypothetical protein
VLMDAQAKSFSTKVVMVKHRDGARTVRYEEFPAEYQPALLARRPAPKTAEQLSVERAATVQKPRPVAAVTPRNANVPKASDPNMRNGCLLSVLGTKNNLAEVEVQNTSDSVRTVLAEGLVCTTVDGRTGIASEWVEANADGRITVIVGSRLTIAAGASAKSFALFRIPPGSTIVKVEWR